ncbi:MAG: hypothetical protein IPO88_21460 [Nannocystis sp.]|uniref:hypothetical protein n=1 Tax=Nannocystis sp. TaxID=1962667 RepID=UPI0024270BE2|nr:hypothetical protein [Nannocystis sp.]MBK9756022.1 hypothetical protein [Nannocystis sp.]
MLRAGMSCSLLVALACHAGDTGVVGAASTSGETGGETGGDTSGASTSAASLVGWQLVRRADLGRLGRGRHDRRIGPDDRGGDVLRGRRYRGQLRRRRGVRARLDVVSGAV